MDTPDKAAGFADSELADAINRDWLLVSANSQLSDDGRRKRRLSSRWLTRSYSVNDETCDQEQINFNKSVTLTSGRDSRFNESSWLLNNRDGKINRSRQGSIATQTLLYDNISFADSSPLIRSVTIKKGYEVNLDQEAGPLNTESRIGRFRIFIACYLLIGITLAIYSRNALSLAAVEMIANNKINQELLLLDSASISPSNMTGDASVPSDDSCPLVEDWDTSPVSTSTKSSLNKEQIINSIKRRVEIGELVDWSPGEQGLIFASGSVGNLLIAIPLTRLGEVYGPKWIIFLALSGATLQAALMPIISGSHVALIILFQVVFNGLTYGADCAAYTFFAHWLTPTEMAFFVACLLVCYQLGAIISSAITAKILVEGIAWSWCFYSPAILCAVWTCIWTFIGASEPTKSWIISDKELEYLLKSNKISQILQNNGNDQRAPANPHHSNKISWLKLAKDPNIWAIVAVKFTLRWYFSVYVSLMPTYLSSVAHMSISTIGKVNVFQSLIGLFSGLLMSYLTKSVVVKRPFNLKLSTVRKIFQSIVNFGLSLSLLAFITFDCSRWVTIVSLALCGICVNFYVAAGLQLPLDLSPDHCGLITSISNTLALGQALGAPISGLILNHGPRSRVMWRIVWGLAILLNTLSGFLFISLVDSKTRDYNKCHACKVQPGTNSANEQGMKKVNGRRNFSIHER